MFLSRCGAPLGPSWLVPSMLAGVLLMLWFRLQMQEEETMSASKMDLRRQDPEGPCDSDSTGGRFKAAWVMENAALAHVHYLTVARQEYDHQVEKLAQEIYGSRWSRFIGMSLEEATEGAKTRLENRDRRNTLSYSLKMSQRLMRHRINQDKAQHCKALDELANATLQHGDGLLWLSQEDYQLLRHATPRKTLS